MVGYRSTDVQARAAAEIFGARVIWSHPRVDPGRTVSVADQLGIPWLYTEARGAGRIHPDDLSMMKNGIVNLMRHLKMAARRMQTGGDHASFVRGRQHGCRCECYQTWVSYDACRDTGRG